MSQVKLDRRVKYTKYALQEAALDLLEDYPISKVSVSMLCKTADVNRSTFYDHYENTPQLVEKMQLEAMENLKNYIMAHAEPYTEITLQKTMVQILTYVAANDRRFRILLGKNVGWDFNGMMRELLHTELSAIMSPALLKDKSRMEYITVFSVSGGTNVIRHWLENGLKESPMQMAKIVTKMLQHSIDMV